MKTKTVKYDDIIVHHYGQDFNHGEIVYKDYIDVYGKKKLTLNVNLGLCILPEDEDKFLQDITNVIGRYAQ